MKGREVPQSAKTLLSFSVSTFFLPNILGFYLFCFFNNYILLMVFNNVLILFLVILPLSQSCILLGKARWSLWAATSKISWHLPSIFLVWPTLNILLLLPAWSHPALSSRSFTWALVLHLHLTVQNGHWPLLMALRGHVALKKILQALDNNHNFLKEKSYKNQSNQNHLLSI